MVFASLCAAVSVSFLAIAMVLGVYAVLGGYMDQFYEWLIDIRVESPTVKPIGIGQVLQSAAQSIIDALSTWYAVGCLVVGLYALDTYRRYRSRRLNPGGQ